MTKKELNRDVKRCWRTYHTELAGGAFGFSDELKDELERLLRVDGEMEYLTYLSAKMLLRMNHAVRAVPLHTMFSDPKI